MRTPTRPTVLALLLLAAAAAAPARAINYGTAQGTLLAAGERYELNHAYAIHRGSVFETGGGVETTITILRLVNGEVAEDAVADDKKFAAAMAAGNRHAVEVHLKDESGEILVQRLYHDGKTYDGAGGEAGTWLRGEYTNKVIWGAIGTDGVQPLGDTAFWRYEVIFAAQFQPPLAAGLDDNAAAGTFKLAGKAAKLVSARAWVEDETPEGGESATFTSVVLASAPLELETARDDTKLLAAAKQGRFSVFKFRIHDQDGAITRQAWITPAGKAESDPDPALRWSSWSFTGDEIVGFVSSDGDRQSGKAKWGVDAHFKAAITSAPAPAE